jgi:HEAT repeat protein
MRRISKITTAVALLAITVGFLLISRPAHGRSIIDPGYVPHQQSIDLWLDEAVALGSEISKTSGAEAKARSRRFNEVLKLLIAIGHKYPEHMNYYREILLNDSDTKKKVLVASILGVLKDRELSGILMKLLGDEIIDNRVTAILYYQDIKDNEIVPKLKSVVKEDPDIRVRIMAARALRTIAPDALER